MERYFCSSNSLAQRHIVYDLVSKNIVLEATEYGRYLRDKEHKRASVLYPTMLAVTALLNYLNVANTSLRNVSDMAIKRFALHEVDAVLAKKQSKRNVAIAQDTVDLKLIAIYRWLLWLQDRQWLPSGTVGPDNCQVTSRLSSYSEKWSRNVKSLIGLYPALFKANNPDDTFNTGPTVTEAQISKARGLIKKEIDPFRGARNLLFFDIAFETPMRRSSINSLTIDQFSQDAVLKLDFTVRPSHQKFDRKKDYGFPNWLAVKVLHFIENERRQLLERSGVDQSNGRLFVSSRTTGPIANRTWTEIVGGYLQDAGAVRFAAVHCGRRTYAQTRGAEIEVDRQSRGLDTAGLTVAMELSLEMGQARPQSLIPYIKSKPVVRRRVKDTIDAQKKRIENLEQEVAQLRREIGLDET